MKLKISPLPFCTLRQYKLKCVWDLHQKKQVGLTLDYFGIKAIGPDWSLVHWIRRKGDLANFGCLPKEMDLGSANAPPPLDHRDSGVGWSTLERNKNMKKVDIVDCVKQIIAINKELEEHDQRQDYHVTWMSELRDRIERLEKLQASSCKPQAWQPVQDMIGWI